MKKRVHIGPAVEWSYHTTKTLGGDYMNYHYLSIEERSCIRKYYVDGLRYREIARMLGRNVSTIPREIRRNCTHMYDIPTYYPHTAQKKFLLRRSYCHRGMFYSREVTEYINENLNGLLQEFYPKGRNLSKVASAALKRNLALINARPRKVLNFHSAQELWDFELNSCCT